MDQEHMRIYWPIGNIREMPTRTDRGDLIEEKLQEYAKRVVGPKTTVTIGWMKRAATTLFTSVYLGMVNDAQMVSDIVEAEELGFDAAMIGPHWDPGLFAARGVCRMPVTGPCESALMVAHTLGHQFAMLTVNEGYVPMIERNIRLYGFESHAISRRPVRRFGMTFENAIAALEGKSGDFLQEFERTARECIADGADVIIAGGQLFGPIFQPNGFSSIPNMGVPVVEVAACGLKYAELLVSLQRSINLRKSEHPTAPFKTPPRDIVERTRTAFHLK